LTELTLNIEKIGVIEPIIVRAKENGRYELVAGGRRVSAAKAAGLKEIPALIRELTDEQAFIFQASENLQRENLTEEEKTSLVVFCIEKFGWKPKEIAQKLGMSYSWVVKYLPDKFKDEQKAEAGTVGGLVSGASRREAEMEETIRLTTCERCHVGTSEAKSWRGHMLCSKCYERAESNPEAYETYFRYVERVKTTPITTPEVWKPREKWEQREARMHPQVSEFEVKFDVEAVKAGLPYGESHKVVCTQHTIPDKTYQAPNGVLHVFFDGSAVHEGREDRDEQLRDALRKQGAIVLSITYERVTDEALQSAIEQVRTELLRLGWTPKQQEA
jgi:ParB-like chromosome segregation protein Spo0J